MVELEGKLGRSEGEPGTRKESRASGGKPLELAGGRGAGKAGIQRTKQLKNNFLENC